MKREPPSRGTLPVSPVYSSYSNQHQNSKDFLDHSNISYFEQGENLPLKTLRPEIFEIFEDEKFIEEPDKSSKAFSRGGGFFSKIYKNNNLREQEDARSSATQRKQATKATHRREVSDILSGYSRPREGEINKTGNNISKIVKHIIFHNKY